MKKLITFFCAFALFSCNNEKKNYTLLTGKIDNLTEENAILSNGDFSQTLNINADGTISDTLKLPEANFYNLRFGNSNTILFLKNNGDVNLTANAKSFESTLKYTGDFASENNYLNSKTLINLNSEVSAQQVYSLDENDFKSKLNEVESKNLEALNTIKNVDEDFLNSEKKNLTYEKYLVYNDYQNAHGYFSGNEEFTISDNFLPEELKTIIFDDEKAYQSSAAYKQMAMNKTLNQIFAEIKTTNNVTVEELKVISDLKIQGLKNDVIAYVGNILLSPANKNMGNIYQFFVENTSNQDIKDSLKATYETNQNLVKGMPSPEFVNYENNAGGKTSLSDLKGKYVYIDVWATWCGPCIAEIPSLKEVEKKYHNKNIEFVSMSIDAAKDHDKWKSMITDKELSGTQIFADNDWQSKFVRDYAIDGIPRFILIDPIGNIVSADAPRPSDPELVTLIDAELNGVK